MNPFETPVELIDAIERLLSSPDVTVRPDYVFVPAGAGVLTEIKPTDEQQDDAK